MAKTTVNQQAINQLAEAIAKGNLNLETLQELIQRNTPTVKYPESGFKVIGTVPDENAIDVRCYMGVPGKPLKVSDKGTETYCTSHSWKRLEKVNGITYAISFNVIRDKKVK